MMEQPRSRSLPSAPPPRLPETVDPLDAIVMSPLHYTELCNCEEDESSECSANSNSRQSSRRGSPTSMGSMPPETKKSPKEGKTPTAPKNNGREGGTAAAAILTKMQKPCLQKQQPQQQQSSHLPQVPSSPVCDTSVTTECTATTKSNSHSQVSTAGAVTALDNCDMEEGGGKTVEAAEGSASVPTDPEPTSFGPLHQKALDNRASEDCLMVAQQMKDNLLSKLSLSSRRGNLTLINLSRQGLGVGDAGLIKQTMTQCPHLSVLKLSYNNFGDEGAAIIASGFIIDGSHHDNLAVLDLGFNMIGEPGCSSLALHAVAGNRSLRTLYLSGNTIRDRGALSLAGAILHGSNLTCLHLTENKIGTVGVKALTRAVAETEALRRADVSYGSHQQLGLCVGQTITSGRNRSTMQTIQELHLGGTCMKSAGFLSVSNMVLTNLSLRVLDLSDNDLDDRDIALFSQSVAQNRVVPFEVLNFSFNNISCAGVECLMNAIWGSKTLQELRLDNNKIKDRGAQLAAVVLTSIQLKVLDLGFNKITTAGVKALMKSLSETSSLTSLTLSGIPLDLPASKAVCYALAYNTSLRHLFIDNCSVSYSAQRHIVAGIVSNQRGSLELVTGFNIGAITVTLGLPEVLESWTNYKVLKFVRMMWQLRHSQQSEARLVQWLQTQSSISRLNPKSGDIQSIGKNGIERLPPDSVLKMEPADPKTVVVAAKAGLAYIGNVGDGVLSTESYQRKTDHTSPVVPANATMLEKTSSGTVRVPSFSQLTSDLDIPSVVESTTQTQENKIPQPVAAWGHSSPDGSAVGNIMDPVRKQQVTEWIRTHFRSVNEVGKLPFNSNDLAQLQIYFYSSIDSSDAVDDNLSVLSNSDEKEGTDVDSDDRSGTSRNYSRKLGRKISFHRVQEAANIAAQLQSEAIRNFCKRRSWDLISTDEDESISASSQDYGPALKRFKNQNLRISRYPRLLAKLDKLRAESVESRTESAESRMLSLLRQIRFVGTLTVQGKNTCKATASKHDREYSFSYADVEIILLDLI